MYYYMLLYIHTIVHTIVMYNWKFLKGYEYWGLLICLPYTTIMPWSLGFSINF